ncbi:piggyBac transposable element-derived protein 2-like [Schistocerca serialis cubense]|uniref:piggyBac transposable element-derived protein 2-like n=1 Tax=Schistocerca serialis cubense TaxID=2023355 RepID=UPI00214E1315|nr:piggyBac transposable element-derived protein 2-like [Schistocerca serialis cubense]
MVYYYRKHSAKMFLREKPIKVGYKIWCLTSSNGFLYNFSPYCGKTDNKQETLGARVINELTSMIPESEYPNCKLFFDNFFTSVDTLITLGKSKMKAAGTITEIRTNACPLIDSKRMFYKKIFTGKKKKEISVTLPHIIEEYNAHMGGIYLLDKQISLYRTRIRSKKWWWPLFTQMIYICVVNTWRAYQIANSNEKLLLLDVRQRIVMFFLSKKKGSVPKQRGPQGSKLMGGRVSTDVRLDPGNIFFVPSKTQKRCAYCKKKQQKFVIGAMLVYMTSVLLHFILNIHSITLKYSLFNIEVNLKQYLESLHAINQQSAADLMISETHSSRLKSIMTATTERN